MKPYPLSHGNIHEGISPQEWIAQTQAHRASYKRLADRISHAYPLTDGRVLDYGCGNGLLLSIMAEHWPSTVLLDGMDIDHELIDWANNQFATDRLHYLHAEKLPPQSINYDLVISTFVSHHWHDPEAYFQDLLHYVKPGGSIYVEDINPQGFYSLLHASRLYYLLFHPAKSDFFGYRQSRQSAYSSSRLENTMRKIAGIDYRLETGHGRVMIHLQKQR